MRKGFGIFVLASVLALLAAVVVMHGEAGMAELRWLSGAAEAGATPAAGVNP